MHLAQYLTYRAKALNKSLVKTQPKLFSVILQKRNILHESATHNRTGDVHPTAQRSRPTTETGTSGDAAAGPLPSKTE